MNDIAIFIISCDKTAHIAKYCLDSLHSNFILENIPIFIGYNKNSNHLTYKSLIKIQVKQSNWRNETLDQIQFIKTNFSEIRFLIVVLDDFIFEKSANINDLFSAISHVRDKKLKHLMLTPISDSIIQKSLTFFTKGEKLSKKNKILPLRKNHPYYSSLQVAIWDIDYFETLVTTAINIWLFEKQKSDIPHFIVCRKIIFYRHVIEKGMWEKEKIKFMQKKFQNAFKLGPFPIKNESLFHLIIKRMRKYSFYIFGYLFYRIRQFTSKIK